VATPSVIGDNYQEMVESLSRLAEAGLSLNIVEPEPPARQRNGCFAQLVLEAV
jgi:hypothetical protein